MKYILKNNSGEKIIVENDFSIGTPAGFEYQNKTYQIVTIDKEEIFCKQIPDKLYEFSHKNDIRLLKYEEKIINFFSKRNIEILPNTLSELSFKKLILTELSKFFIIEEEVIGKHFSGRKMIIDAILKPKDNQEWRNKSLVFGLEFKNPLVWETSNRRDTDLLAQCLDYSFSKFKDYSEIIIILAPLLPSLNRQDKLLRFISRYNVGYLDFSKTSICFEIGGQRLWTEHRTTSILKKSMLKKKYGNRGYK